MAHDLAQQVQRRATRMHEMVERQGVDVSKLVRLSSGDAYMRSSETMLEMLCHAGVPALARRQASSASKP